jgi:hypothetical protein
MDGAPLVAAIGPLAVTTMENGVRETIALYRRAAAAGRLAVDQPQ